MTFTAMIATAFKWIAACLIACFVLEGIIMVICFIGSMASGKSNT